MIAIITGNIIDSTKVPIDKRKKLISVIKEAISYVSKFSPLKYEIFRGNGKDKLQTTFQLRLSWLQDF